MRAENLSEAAINAFAHAYRELRSGSTGCIPEDSLHPVASLVDLQREVSGVVEPDVSLLRVMILKLYMDIFP
jgi:hypothetical protein